MIQMFYGIFSFMIGALPDGKTLSPEIAMSVTTIFGYVRNLDFLIPISTLVTLLGLALAFQFGVFTYRNVGKILRMVRGN